MNTAHPDAISIADAASQLRTKQLSPVELTASHLSSISRWDPVLHAFITVLHEEAMQAAREAESEIVKGRYRGPLPGIPIAIKDNISIKGHPTTCGSKLLAQQITSVDAAVVARLREAGAIIVGKTTMMEFAMGDDINPLTGAGPTRNPWNLDRSTNGSSSGSAAAVAAALCGGALGTDTGGSIRTPAAYCGIVGMKATFDLVSAQGVVPLAWSMDHVGPMTRSVEDNALLLQAIAKPPAATDSSRDRGARDYAGELGSTVRGIRVGVPKRYFMEYLVADVAAAFLEVTRVLEKEGVEIVEVDLPHLQYLVGAWNAICLSEALAYHEQYLRRGLFAEYSAFNRASFDAARFVSGADYLQAQRARRAIINDFETALQKADVIIAPMMSVEANTIAEDLTSSAFPTRETPAGKLSLFELAVRLAGPASLTGMPALALPMGFSASDLPFGLQIMGRAFDERRVYSVGFAYEQATQWHDRAPSFQSAGPLPAFM